MPSKWFGARFQPFNDYDDLFKGKQALIPMNVRHKAEFYDQMSLWYFSVFPGYKPDAETDLPFYAFIGVFDVDLVFRDNDQRESFLKTCRDPEHYSGFITTLFGRIFKNLPQRYFQQVVVYHSGSKGLHIYIQHPDFMVRVERKAHLNTASVLAHFKKLGVFQDMAIDTSIYAYGSGIRPYTVPNPKTGLMPRRLICCLDVFDIWDWLCDFDYNISTCETLSFEQTPVVAPSLALSDSANRIETAPSRFDSSGPILVLDFIGEKLKQCLYPQNYHYDPRTCMLTIRIGMDYCCIANKVHKRNSKTIWKVDEWHATQYCLSAKCRGRLFTLKLKTCPPNTDFFTVLGIVPDADRFTCFGESKYLPDMAIENAKLLAPVLVVASPMGSGKTTQLMAWQRARPELSVLIICSRRCQVTMFEHKFAGFVHYEKVEGSLFGEKKLVICLNSLMRILSADKKLPQFDVIIIDEIQTTLDQITSTLLSNYKCWQLSIMKLVVVLLRTCKHAFLMDGLPQPRLWQWLERYKLLCRCHIIYHASQPEKRRFEFCSTPYKWDKLLRARLSAGNNVVVCTNSKQMAYYVYSVCGEALEPEERLVIYGDSTEEEKLTSGNPDLHWSKLRLLVYNNALGPGADFSLPWFDEVFFFYTCTSGLPNEMDQLIHRVRETKSNSVICMIMHKEFDTVKAETNLCKRKHVNSVYDYLARINRIPVRFGELGTEATLLDAGENDLSIVHNLSDTRPELYMQYEDQDFLDTLYLTWQACLRARDSATFTEDFYQILRQDGAIVVPPRKRVDAKQCGAFLAQKKRQTPIRVTDDRFVGIEPEIVEKHLIEQYKLDRVNKYRFVHLMSALQKDATDTRNAVIWFNFNPQKEQPKPVFSTPGTYDYHQGPKHAVALTEDISVVASSLKIIFTLLELRLENGYIIGQFAKSHLASVWQALGAPLEKIYAELFKLDNTKLYTAPAPDSAKTSPAMAIERQLISVFGSFSLSLQKTKLNNKFVSTWHPETRQSEVLYSVCVTKQELMYCLAGCDPQNVSEQKTNALQEYCLTKFAQ